jgi:hypothetical protein
MPQSRCKRSFSPVLISLETRVALSGIASPGAHASVLVQPLAKKPAPTLTGSASGSLSAFNEMTTLLGNLTSGSLVKYGPVTGSTNSIVNLVGVATGTEITLNHTAGHKKSVLELFSIQQYMLTPNATTNTELQFRVAKASGIFSSFTHHEVNGEVSVNVDAHTIAVTFPG